MITIGLENNDIKVDKKGNIFIKDGANQIAQDVASSIKVWKGECPLDTERGIVYTEADQIRNTLMFDINEQAQRIEGVINSTVIFNSIEDRKLNTTVYITTQSGENVDVNEYIG